MSTHRAQRNENVNILDYESIQSMLKFCLMSKWKENINVYFRFYSFVRHNLLWSPAVLPVFDVFVFIACIWCILPIQSTAQRMRHPSGRSKVFDINSHQLHSHWPLPLPSAPPPPQWARRGKYLKNSQKLLVCFWKWSSRNCWKNAR